MSEPRPKRNPPNKQSRIISSNSVAIKSPVHRHQTILEKTDLDQIMRVDIVIRINEGDELDPSFIDYFSKYIVNTTHVRLDQSLFNGRHAISYSDFFCSLKTLHQKTFRINKYFGDRHSIDSPESKMFKKSKPATGNMRKGSADSMPLQTKATYRFTFESYQNCITLLLDLSPYMTIFEYSTKNYPIMVLQDIVRNLINIGLTEHYKQNINKETYSNYYLTVYCFSSYTGEIIQIIDNQEIVFDSILPEKKKNRDQILNYILDYINASQLPHQTNRKNQKVSIGAIIQKILNMEKTSSVIKTIITISTFKNIQDDSRIFFNCNWHTFAFVCPGHLNFGSYFIDSEEIKERYSFNQSFITKYVYNAEYVENWKKMQIISHQPQQCEGRDSEKLIKFKYHKSKPAKNKAILYCGENGKKQSIFEQILVFKLQVAPRPKQFTKTMTERTMDTKTMIKQKFTIPEDKIGDIIRTKYLQGWQQIYKEQTVENTRLAFKLQFSSQRAIYYEAKLIQDNYDIVVREKRKLGMNLIMSEQKNQQEIQDTQMIKMIDMINTSNFDILKSNQNNPAKSRRNINFITLHARYKQKINLLEFILNSHKEWNKFFKTRTVYVEFKGNLSNENLNEFLESMNSFLGSKIQNFFYMKKQKLKGQSKDKIKPNQGPKYKIIFTKIGKVLNFIELKLGFLKFKDNEISDSINSLKNKLSTVKLKKATIFCIPEDIYKFCRAGFNIQNGDQFNISWNYGLRQSRLYGIFKVSNKNMIQKVGYQFLGSKTQMSRQIIAYYYKIIAYKVNENEQRKKGIFLTITSDPQNLVISCRISAFPQFSTVFVEKANPHKQEKRDQSELPLKSFSNVKNELKILEPQLAKSFPQIFKMLVKQVKQPQIKFLKSIQNYYNIHRKLLKRKIAIGKSEIQSRKLMRKISALHNISYNQWFQSNYISELREILHKHYGKEINQENQQLPIGAFTINIDDLIEPNELLMNSKIFSIKGDFSVKSNKNPQKKYIFFLLTPNRPVYIWKKPESTAIFYRCIPPIFQEEHKNEINKENVKDLNKIFKEQLICRINQQEQYEKYFYYYTLISTGKIPQQKDEDEALNDRFSQPLKLKSLSDQKNLKNVSNYLPFLNQATRKLNKSQFLQAISNQEQKMEISIIKNFDLTKICSIYEDNNQIPDINNSMIKVIREFSQKIFEFISIFFAKSQEEIAFENWKQNKEIMKFLDNWTGDLTNSQTSFSDDQKSQDMRKSLKLNQVKESFIKDQSLGVNEQFGNTKIKSYYFERKNLTSNEELGIKQNQNSQHFNNIVLKILSGDQQPLHKGNIIDFLLKIDEAVSQSKKSKISVMRIHAYGYQLKRDSYKMQWLSNTIENLVQECELRLKMIQVLNLSAIQELQNEIDNKHKSMVKYQPFRIPDVIWAKKEEMLHYFKSSETILFIQHKQNHHQKFLAVEMAEKNHPGKPGQKQIGWDYRIFYWLSIEVLPTKFLRTKMVEFKYLKYSSGLFSEERMSKIPNYSDYLKKIIDQFLEEQIKIEKAKRMLLMLNRTLKLPESPEFSEFILSQNISDNKKSGKQKKKVPKKFSSKNKNNQTSQGQVIKENKKNIVGIPFLYANFIQFIPIFEQNEIMQRFLYEISRKIAIVTQMNNTLIFENTLLKQFLIIELDIVPDEYTADVRKSEHNMSFSSQVSGIKNQGTDIKSRFIKYQVYCLDRNANKEIIEKSQIQLLRQNMRNAVLLKMSQILESQYNFEEDKEQVLQMGKSFEIRIPIPFISQKGNFRQLLKQHLQSQFFHKKISLKNKSSCKPSQQQDPSTNTSQSADPLSPYKKNISRAHLSSIQNECQNRCERLMWAFNSYDSDEKKDLSVLIGSCLSLVKFEIKDKYPTVNNVRIWKRQTKPNEFKTYIYGVDENSDSPYPESEKLSNYLLDPQSYFKKKENLIMNLSSQFTDGDANQTVLEDENQSEVVVEILSSFGQPKFQQISQIYKKFVYDSIFDYFVELNLINNMFYTFKHNINEGLAFSVKEAKRKGKKTLKQKYSQKSFSLQKHPQILHQSQISQSIDEQSSQQIEKPIIDCLKRSESSPEKIVHLEQQEDHYDNNRIYKTFLNTLNCLQEKLCKRNKQSFYIHRTINELYIEQPFLLLKKMMIEVILLFKTTKDCPDEFIFPFIIYAIHGEKIYFWDLSLLINKTSNTENMVNRETQHVEEQVEKLSIDKIGFFFLDILPQIKEMNELMILKGCIDDEEQQGPVDAGIRKKYIMETAYPEIEKIQTDFKWMKNYPQDKSFCQTSYLFKRSLICHFQVLDTTSFRFFTYNLKCYSYEFQVFRHKISEYEYWFTEKLRFLNFIKNVKAQNGKLLKCQKTGFQSFYQPFVLPKETILIPESRFEEGTIERVKEGIERTKSNNEPKPSLRQMIVFENGTQRQMFLTKIMIKIVFDKLPPKNFSGMRSKLNIMYHVLSASEVNYENYPQYDGQEKSKLEKLGKQYLSILRTQYGRSRQYGYSSGAMKRIYRNDHSNTKSRHEEQQSKQKEQRTQSVAKMYNNE